MSVLSALQAKKHDCRTVVFRAVFGDRLGLAVFLGGLCFFTFYWRVGVFITDTNAILNTLVNVAEGHLYIDQAPYGAGKIAPGTYVSGERAYGRNYAVVFATLPVYLGLDALATVLDVGLLVVGLWPLTLVAFTMTLGTILNKSSITVAGSAFALAVFLANVPLAAPLDPALLPVVSLQLVTMVVTAMCGVFVYRLLAQMHTSQIGVLAAGAVFLGTPVAFWAAFPKRHSFTILLLFATAYAFYRSRVEPEHELRYRSLAYVPVGLMAWIHSAEALILFLPLVAVDIPTATTNDRRSLGVVALVFLVSMIPFFLTNFAISGNPLEPPRMLTPYDKTAEEVPLQSGGGGTGDLFGDSLPGQILSKTIGIGSVFGSLLVDGVVVTITEPSRVFRTLIRSGFLPEAAELDNSEAISLTVLEAAPILAALLALPVLVARRVSQTGRNAIRVHAGTPAGAVDLFALGCALLVFVLYIPRLPNNAQVTVRYLHPLYPLGVYALARTPQFRDTVVKQIQPALWSYVLGVLVGGQLLVITIVLLDPGFGESIQLHALVALATATILGVWTIASLVSDEVPNSYGGVAMGLTAAVSTVFVLLALLWHFTYASVYAVPVLEHLFEMLSTL